MSENEASTSKNTDETVVSLQEAIEDELEMYENATAVLGVGNGKNCTYPDGYIKRQALYSCLTCIPKVKDDYTVGAGLCVACSYHCHDGHDLVELYTRRNFRCDCGNKKFNALKCHLYENKTEVNEKNVYNQNYSGIYCVCRRPYPDDEDPLPDEMIQCVICEDWYHTRHLGTETPSATFTEMICEACVRKHPILQHYDAKIIEQKDVKVDDGEDVKCKKPKTKTDKIQAMFWPDVAWRQELCNCDDCKKSYDSIEFLLDPNDSVQIYEEKNKDKAEEEYQKTISNELNSLGRVGMVEFISGFNDFKQSLSDFLGKFGENKRIIRVEDVKEFFEDINAKKKQKVDGAPPAFCR